MIYAGILAAGLGERMHRQDLPKQFLPLGEKPIIIHTVEQFLLNMRVDKIIVVVPSVWDQYAVDLLGEYDHLGKEIAVITGGQNKTESIYLITEFIKKHHEVSEADILIAHDAIRPFVTQRIINDNIDTAEMFSASNTAMVTNDALLISKDGIILDEVPNHEIIYAEQTPQTYKLQNLINVLGQAKKQGIAFSSVNELPRLYIQSGCEMKLVRGEYSNMKIINPYDLEVANALLKERKNID
jgi:2-C-methyl-D-erythritol 4-phosphate cytidylyltransferase